MTVYIEAIKERRELLLLNLIILHLPYNHYTTNFATMLADAYYISKIIYLEVFKNLTVEEKADQIHKKFVYNLNLFHTGGINK